MTQGRPTITGEQIGAWSARSRVPGELPELSDAAAVLIAAGHLRDEPRAVIVRRVAAGLPIPTVPGGFHDLRQLQRAIDVTESQLAAPMVPGVVAAVLRSRRNSLTRRREDLRKSSMGGKAVFAGSVRGIRRERREGVHLEMTDRERLFDALLRTPTPNLDGGGYVRRAGSLAADRMVSALGQVAVRAGASKVEEWISALGVEVGEMPSGQSRFVDGYETILALTGTFYDRVIRSPAWHSEHFELQRTQLNLHAEVADIAADVIALRSVRVDLERSRRNAGFDESFRAHIDSREQSLRPVWAQLIERVRALAGIAEVMESAAVELRLLDEFAHTATIDERIDRLVARSGSREMSADNADRMREQIKAGEEQLRIYRDVLQGNLIALPSNLGGRAGSDAPPQSGD
ncbi:hypothetical protein GCM10027169_02920 [Gordonia jinhuaensis]|uniref:Uncharacterized protein n=1 Tax=Gordonia jinhuaensis TaxID=1517702 RepID=A0A916T2K5_9ACTN|nr:hypothetical protein [Gordonia jinhuaensis]GGB28951.1 hypothetical protein GCM10011489_16460 [Gordonia jinhuaensis]